VFWVELAEGNLAAATTRLPRLGYTTAVDRLVPAAGPAEVRWRRRSWRLVRRWEEDAAGHRELAPDRRAFLFPAGGGPVRPVRGYRGGGGPLTRRGLPVCDARLLVNLVAPAGPGWLLDPFAGVGGVALAARAAGWTTVTADLDAGLRHGLGAIAAHLVADARALPLGPGSLDAAVTEPPYEPAVGPLAGQALAELHRLLRPGGAAAVLCAAWQAPGLRSTAAGLGWRVVLDCPVDRKGLAVVALAWRRP
jgi:SAM-dependent methyltransferase